MKIIFVSYLQISVGTFQIYCCFYRQKKTSQFLFLFKIKPFYRKLSNHHFRQREQYLTKFFFSVTCEPTIFFFFFSPYAVSLWDLAIDCSERFEGKKDYKPLKSFHAKSCFIHK
jgi:hypothetical protein